MANQTQPQNQTSAPTALALTEAFEVPKVMRQATIMALGTVLAITTMVLAAGWMAGNEFLTRFSPGYAAMVPSTAISLTLAASVVLFGGTQARIHARLQRLVGLALLAIAIANLAILAASGNGLDLSLWPNVEAFQTERMSIATSLCILLVAIAFWSDKPAPTGKLIYVWAATVGLILNLFALSVYMFHADSLYMVALFTNVSLPSATCLSVIFAGLLMRRPEWGWVSLLLGNGWGSRAARRLLPLLVGFPLSLVLVTGLATQSGIIDDNFRSSALAVILIVALISIVAFDARRTNALQRKFLIQQEQANLAREAEREAVSAKDAAESAMAIRQSFLANMSHEIRTPMNGVMGFAELLLMTELNERQREYVEIICESGQSMVNILNDILDLAKIESGALTVMPTSADPRHLAQSTVRLMRAASDRKGLTLNCIVEPHVPPRALLDKLRVKQVLSNLIGNAIKFTSEGEVTVIVSIKGKNEERLIEFLVTDTGIGIPKARRAAIFDQFVRTDSAAKLDHSGAGLGLPISRSLAELMGGTLTLKSKEGFGTEARLSLPLQCPIEKTGDGTPDDQDIGSDIGQRAVSRILIAEDQNVNQLLVEKILSNLGYDTDLASNGAQAVEKVCAANENGAPYDLVLMDLQMPTMGGLAATRKIRNLGIAEEDLPIIALTAFAYEQDIRECLEAGMQDHIAKPLKPAELLTKVNYWLGGQPTQKSIPKAG